MKRKETKGKSNTLIIYMQELASAYYSQTEHRDFITKRIIQTMHTEIILQRWISLHMKTVIHMDQPEYINITSFQLCLT